MTNIDDIDQLLEKYFEGESSLDEEKTLRQYFSQGNVAKEYMQYKPLFVYLNNEHSASTIPNTIEKQNVNKRISLKQVLKLAVAASVAIFLYVGISYKYQKMTDNQTIAYIDGVKISNVSEINLQAMVSLSNVSDISKETVGSQIDVLDSFIE